MRVSLTGDFSALEKAVSTLSKAARKGAINEVKRALADESLRLVRKGFDRGVSPDGQRWAGGKNLVQSGALRNSVAVRLSGSQITMTSGLPYASIHQFGGTIQARNGYLTFKIDGQWRRARSVTIPARPFLPANGVPADWAESFNDIVAKKLDELFQGF